MNYEYRNNSHNSPMSISSPTTIDLENAKSLQTILRNASYLQEHPNHRSQREDALEHIDAICQQWVQLSAVRQEYPKEFVDLSKVRLFTYGSFKLNVYCSTDDLDILCVGPSFLTRDLFFDELGNMLKLNPYISDFIAIRNAYVPVISFKYHNCVDIDIVYAQLQTELIDYYGIMNDHILYGLDLSSILSINGVRFAKKLLELVPNKHVFRLSLRAVRYWAKQRAIYSNKIGFLGGVSWAIMTARVCQLYPNANASQIIQNFFDFYHKWNFQSPFNAITLCEIVSYENMPDIHVWDPYSVKHKHKQSMYIITPVFPAINSSHNVSLSTFNAIKREIARGFHLISKTKRITVEKWQDLFAKHTFFMDYKKYIFIKSCSQQSNISQWSGLIESKIRLFVHSLEWNCNHGSIELTPFHACIEMRVSQSDIDSHTHSEILKQNKKKSKNQNKTAQSKPLLEGQLFLGKNSISCCGSFDNNVLKTKAEKTGENYQCRAFVIGINDVKDVTKNGHKNKLKKHKNKKLDLTASVSQFLKSLNNIYNDSHVIIELLSCYELPHFLFPEFNNRRPNQECIETHQIIMSLKQEKYGLNTGNEYTHHKYRNKHRHKHRKHRNGFSNKTNANETQHRNSFIYKFNPSMWQCHKCGFSNWNKNEQCKACFISREPRSLWQRLQPFPFQNDACVHALNKDEFIVCPNNNKMNYYVQSDGIYKYNIPNNEWSQYIAYDNGFDCQQHACTINSAKQTLMLYNGVNYTLSLFDLKRHKLVSSEQIDYVGFGAEIVYIGNVTLSEKDTFELSKDEKHFLSNIDDLHIIGGQNNHFHLIREYKNIYSRWRYETHSFDEFVNGGVVYHRVVHLKSQNRVLLFGGRDGGCVRWYDSIYGLSLQTMKWSKLGITLPNGCAAFGIVTSADEKYIIMFGGATKSKDSDNIYIFNTEQNVLRESGIKCPMKGVFDASVGSDIYREEMLTFGFIGNGNGNGNCERDNSALAELEMNGQLKKSIAKFVEIEYVHLLNYEFKMHWKISLGHILNKTKMI